jgi:hypothetical protein
MHEKQGISRPAAGGAISGQSHARLGLLGSRASLEKRSLGLLAWYMRYLPLFFVACSLEMRDDRTDDSSPCPFRNQGMGHTQTNRFSCARSHICVRTDEAILFKICCFSFSLATKLSVSTRHSRLPRKLSECDYFLPAGTYSFGSVALWLFLATLPASPSCHGRSHILPSKHSTLLSFHLLQSTLLLFKFHEFSLNISSQLPAK